MQPPPLPVHVLLPEARLAEEFVAAFAARFLPEKFFYWSPLSVRAWLDLCGQGAYRNFSRSHQLVQRWVDAGLPGIDGPLDVWSLGTGNGEKDVRVLEALRARGLAPRYRGVDASLGLLEIACAAATAAGFEAVAYKADLADAAHRAVLQPLDPDRPRLVLLLGNTLGGLDPLAFAGPIGAFLRPQDLVLVDGELGAGPDTLAGYDNPVNRRFAFAPLASLGLADHEDGELRFEYRDDDRRPGLTLVAKFFSARRDLRLNLGGTPLPLAAGETLRMSSSHKYTREAFVAVLRELAGLEVLRLEIADDGRYAMALARRRS